MVLSFNIKNYLESSNLASHCLHSLICFLFAGKNTLLFCSSSFYLFTSFIFVVLRVEHGNASSVFSGLTIENYTDILENYIDIPCKCLRVHLVLSSQVEGGHLPPPAGTRQSMGISHFKLMAQHAMYQCTGIEYAHETTMHVIQDN